MEISNESDLLKYYRELLFEHEMDAENTMPFHLWLCGRLQMLGDMLRMSANANKDLQEKLTVYENQWEPSKQEQIDSFSEKFDQLDEEYQDLVKISTALYKADREAIKEMLNESLGPDSYERLKNHIGV